jgi:hypothetical protein
MGDQFGFDFKMFPIVELKKLGGQTFIFNLDHGIISEALEFYRRLIS